MTAGLSFQQQLEQVKDPSLKIIGEYLLNRDDMKEKLEKPNKSLKECWAYIMGEVRETAYENYACLKDETVFGLAVHYYDEDDIKVKALHEKVKTSNSINSNKKPEQVIKQTVKKKTAKKEKQIEEQISLF